MTDIVDSLTIGLLITFFLAICYVVWNSAYAPFLHCRAWFALGNLAGGLDHTFGWFWCARLYQFAMIQSYEIDKANKLGIWTEWTDEKKPGD